eukprot:5415982-Amphidinium_carterae.1
MRMIGDEIERKVVLSSTCDGLKSRMQPCPACVRKDDDEADDDEGGNWTPTDKWLQVRRLVSAELSSTATCEQPNDVTRRVPSVCTQLANTRLCLES